MFAYNRYRMTDLQLRRGPRLLTATAAAPTPPPSKHTAMWGIYWRGTAIIAVLSKLKCMLRMMLCSGAGSGAVTKGCEGGSHSNQRPGGTSQWQPCCGFHCRSQDCESSMRTSKDMLEHTPLDNCLAAAAELCHAQDATLTAYCQQ